MTTGCSYEALECLYGRAFRGGEASTPSVDRRFLPLRAALATGSNCVLSRAGPIGLIP